MAFACQKVTDIYSKKNTLDPLSKYSKEGTQINQFSATENPKNSTFDSKTEGEVSEIPKSIQEILPEWGTVNPSSPKLLHVNEVLSNLRRPITDLPPALISEILDCLNPKELGIVSCVSTSLYKLASELNIWKEFYCDRWGHPIARSPAAVGYSDEKSWKELFVEREFRSKTFMGRYSMEDLYGHAEAVRAVFLLSSKKLIFTSGYDQTVRMWDMEEGLSIASSRPLGCTVRAVAADSRLLVAGGTEGFIHGWRGDDTNPHLFDLRSPLNQNTQFRLWEHEGPVTCLALDLTRIYSGSWDMTIRVWDRFQLKCLKILSHSDWVWSLVPHDTTVASTAGSDVHIWDTNNGNRIAIIDDVHVGYTYSLARSRTGNLLFTGGEDGAIHMFEITTGDGFDFRRVSTWIPHTGPVHSLSFEFPWLVSASSDGKVSLIDVRKLMNTNRRSKHDFSLKNAEAPQRMLQGFGPNLFSVDIGDDRIVCGGEEGVVRIWNFSRALEIEKRVRALRGIRLENRMRRRKLQTEMTGGKGGSADQCSVAAKKNQINGDRNSWHNKRGISRKLKA